MADSLPEIRIQLPSPPSSPGSINENIENYKSNENENKKLKINKNLLATPEEKHIQIDKNEILRKKYFNIMKEGIEINDEMIPYLYAIEKLHSIGNSIINKRTKDAIQFRVYETGKDTFQEFWVHPMFLSLQSFQFFKLFEEIKNNNEEEEIIEIEVPSLNTFPVILYWLYTGNESKLLEIAKLDETLCKGIMENIQFLEINMPSF